MLMYLHENLKLYQVSELISAFTARSVEFLMENFLNDGRDGMLIKVLTVNADFNPFADARWN